MRPLCCRDQAVKALPATGGDKNSMGLGPEYKHSNQHSCGSLILSLVDEILKGLLEGVCENLILLECMLHDGIQVALHLK